MDLVAFEVSIFLARLLRAMYESAKVVVVFYVHNIFQSMFERQRLLQRLCNKAEKKKNKINIYYDNKRRNYFFSSFFRDAREKGILC